MQLRPDIQLQSVLKAMNDVVLPALDPLNPLAQEQARLCMGMLSLMASQLPLQYRFDCDELSRWLALAERLSQDAQAAELAPQAHAELAEHAAQGLQVLARAQAEPAELLSAIKALRAATSSLVRDAAAHASQGQSAELERAVLAAAQAQLLRDRAWVLGQGWESQPQNLPPIASLLAPVNACVPTGDFCS